MRQRVYRFFTAVVLLLAFSSGALAQQPITLRVVGWNMEGNGKASTSRLEKQLGAKQGVDIWGLSEVRKEFVEKFRKGAAKGENAKFAAILSESGGRIRLAIIYNKDKLKLLGSSELFDLFDLQPSSLLRAPLVAHFQGIQSKQEFLFMVNHLASGNAETNTTQAKALVTWIREQTLPVIAVGDYNFRLNIRTGKARSGWKIMKQAWFELEPLHRIATFQRPFSGVEDFIFIGNRDKAVGWTGVSQVLRRANDTPAKGTFPDTNKDTDHRPVEARFSFSPVQPPDPKDTKELMREILRRLDSLERRLNKLENK